MSVETEPGQNRNKPLRTLGNITIVAFVVGAVCAGVIFVQIGPIDVPVVLRPWLSFVVIGVGLIASFTVLITLFKVIERVICRWPRFLQIVIQVVYVLAGVLIALLILCVSLFLASWGNGKTVTIGDESYVTTPGFWRLEWCYQKTIGPFLMESKCSFERNPDSGGSPGISPPELQSGGTSGMPQGGAIEAAETKE